MHVYRRDSGGVPAAGPGAMAVTELSGRSSRSPARRLASLIAVGIGLHNFGEGLAIGGSAAKGEITLATLLVIGFALHNATEGFGIVAPLAAADDRPSWGLLALLGLIGGGPTFLGTAVGHQYTSDAVTVAFLTLAARDQCSTSSCNCSPSRNAANDAPWCTGECSPAWPPGSPPTRSSQPAVPEPAPEQTGSHPT